MVNDPKIARCLKDPSWKFYRDTDLKRTFARVRKAMKEADKHKPANVCQMKARKP